MTAPTTQKRIIFVGSYLDLFNALQAAREQQDNERVTDALMERRADDRQAVDEAFTDAWQVEPEEPPTVQDAVDLIFGQHRLTGRRKNR
jgi:hypothetical protein